MDNLYYLYYRLFNYYKKDNDTEIFAKISTFICLTGLLWINILTLLFFSSTLFFKGQSLLNYVFGSNPIYNKFVVTPLLILPIFVFLFLFINKGIKRKIALYETENAIVRKKRGIKVVVYIVVSVILLMLSIISPVFL